MVYCAKCFLRITTTVLFKERKGSNKISSKNRGQMKMRSRHICNLWYKTSSQELYPVLYPILILLKQMVKYTFFISQYIQSCQSYLTINLHHFFLFFFLPRPLSYECYPDNLIILCGLSWCLIVFYRLSDKWCNQGLKSLWPRGRSMTFLMHLELCLMTASNPCENKQWFLPHWSRDVMSCTVWLSETRIFSLWTLVQISSWMKVNSQVFTIWKKKKRNSVKFVVSWFHVNVLR